MELFLKLKPNEDTNALLTSVFMEAARKSLVVMVGFCELTCCDKYYCQPDGHNFPPSIMVVGKDITTIHTKCFFLPSSMYRIDKIPFG